ncbi:lipopolysaccharide biosynthesis protein [Streptomyces tirandamycinicus]|uniref:lipopolysaccharide biosynthesis protein n=1 Tax=Streptomyces tirandamycinicus TaxID=2174846 RepID=UPI0022701553|nr:lipopolysaccharide biosynthesis protein [Streptomyces tirandamycinicus]MCY0981223.1 lipopolysaccharide biosynthesis protein [Streptomyces tirandamycinicus]
MAETTRVRAPGTATGGTAPSGEAPGGSAGGASMFRNAYALMLSTGVSAALGLGFWLVAARYFTEEAVGQGSAAIAAMRLLASITATTMIGAVVRYVPRAGRATGPLVWRAYAVSSAVVCVACAAFLVTLDLWGPSYAPLRGPVAGAVFTAACVGWALLTLQDGVLTGLREAVWVPVGNAVFSVGKLLLLVVFAGALPVLGVFVSWAAAIALSVLPLGWLVFRRLIPRHAAAEGDREPPRMRDVGRFLAGDSVGALFSLAMINLLPVMVAVRFDAAHNGFFYIAYTVGGTMEFMAINMASSLTAHASHSPGSLADGVRGALRRMALLLVPVVAVLVVFAPVILAPFGADYAEHGTTVLRLLAAAALPRVVVELYIGVLRVQGRTGVLAALQGAMCAMVLGSAAFLMGPAGISGAGLAMLLSMALMALVSAPGLRAALAGREPRPACGTRLFAPRRRAAADGFGTTWARRAAAGRESEGRESEGRESEGPLSEGPLSAGRASDAAGEAGDRAREAVLLRELREAGEAGELTEAGDPAPGTPVHQAGTPAPRTPAHGPREGLPAAGRGGEYGAVAWLWLLLGIAAGLFWFPLARAGDVPPGPLTGPELLHALPPPTVAAGVLLVVAYSGAVALSRLRPVLLTAALLTTAAALHTAPALLGVRPPPVSGPGHEALAGLLTGPVGIAGPAELRAVLPPLLQLLCLGLAATALRALGAPGRTTAAAVWVLAVTGWAAQGAFAAAALPVSAGFLTAAVAALVHRRTGRRDGRRKSLSGSGPAA